MAGYQTVLVNMEGCMELMFVQLSWIELGMSGVEVGIGVLATLLPCELDFPGQSLRYVRDFSTDS